MTVQAAIHQVVRILSMSAAAVLLSSCGIFGDSGPVRVAIIGNSSQISDPDSGPMSPASALLGSAVAQGLVSFTAEGKITGGLAERWTVTDDGLSYIFRLRDAQWSNGKDVTTQDIARILNQRRMAVRNPMNRYMGNIASIRAMTAHVIEVRLARPQRDFLMLLAQPEMAMLNAGRGWGPYQIKRDKMISTLTPVVDRVAIELGDAEALDEDDSIQIVVRPVARAIARYKNGKTDAILGGRFQDWPALAAADIAGDAIRIDPASGLFGLHMQNGNGILGDKRTRIAVNTAIHRSRMVNALNLEGWQPQAGLRPLSAALDPGLPLIEPEWASVDPAQRKAEARRVIDGWKARTGQAARLRIALPNGYGSRIIFAYIAADLRAIGVTPVRVGANDVADLRLIDEIAPWDDPMWYLQRLSCWRDLPCNREIDAKIRDGLSETNMDVRNSLLIQAEEAMQADPYFIPLATPVRWSVTSSRLGAFRTNMRARHPLNQLRRSPT